jgi:hypothetical protein
MRPLWKLGAGFVLAGLCASAHAGALVWDQQKVGLVIQPEQGQAVAEFGFRNGGSLPVTIVSAEPSCGCITPSLSKAVYAPGESGKLKVLFKVGNRTGLQEKTIDVTTDERGAVPTRLVLAAEILQFLSVEPRLLTWAVGGDASELTITCVGQTEHVVRVTGVKCSLPGITVKIDALEPGRRYAVRLRSATHDDHDTALIEVNAEIEGVGPRQYRAYAYYR